MKSQAQLFIRVGILVNVVLISIGLSSCAVDKNAKQRSALVGTWQTDSPEGRITWTLRSDGVYVGAVGSDKFSGTWDVKDGYLVTKLTSGGESQTPVNSSFSDEILELSDDHFVIRSTETGRTERHQRVK